MFVETVLVCKGEVHLQTYVSQSIVRPEVGNGSGGNLIDVEDCD